MKIKKIYKGILKYKNEIDHLAPRIGVPRLVLYLDCVWSYLRWGCVLNHYIHGHFYKLRRYERNRAFTLREWNRIITRANDRDVIHFMKNKVDFNKYYTEYVKRDWLYSKNMSYDEFVTFIHKHDSAIVKPMSGLEGDGVHLVNFTKDLNSKELYDKYVSEDVLIEEKIIQHPNMVFGNKSVNTIRAYTIYDDITDDVYLLKTVIRVGIGDSIVDNSHSGGCAYEIDKSTGYIISPSYCANGLITYIHPGTEICMLGKKIPYWEDVVETCKKAAMKLPKCRFIGWDVAITEDGPLLIEGNHTPDLDMVEFVGSHGYKNLIREHLHI